MCSLYLAPNCRSTCIYEICFFVHFLLDRFDPFFLKRRNILKMNCKRYLHTQQQCSGNELCWFLFSFLFFSLKIKNIYKNKKGDTYLSLRQIMW